MKDNRPRALAVLIAVFLIGILLGAGGSYVWMKPATVAGKPADDKRPSPPNGPQPKMPEFNLTQEQLAKMKPVWEETAKKIRALIDEQRASESVVNKKIDEIIAENDRQIRPFLDEKQKALFDPWVEKTREWRKRGRPRRMGPELPKENPRGSEPLKENPRNYAPR